MNEAVWLCYQHSNKVRQHFNSFEDADLIQKNLASDDIHVPKECLIAGMASLTNSDPFNIIIIWPTCSKKDFSRMVTLCSEISQG